MSNTLCDNLLSRYISVEAEGKCGIPVRSVSRIGIGDYLRSGPCAIHGPNGSVIPEDNPRPVRRPFDEMFCKDGFEEMKSRFPFKVFCAPTYVWPTR